MKLMEIVLEMLKRGVIGEQQECVVQSKSDDKQGKKERVEHVH